MEDAEKEAILIDLVEPNPCLYDKRQPHYKNKVYKSKVWEGISQLINSTVEECVAKWESIRVQYLAHQRKLKAPSGSAKKKRPYFRHEERMKFLGDVNVDESTFTNVNLVRPNSSSTANDDSNVSIPENYEDNTNENLEQNCPPSESATNYRPTKNAVQKSKKNLVEDQIIRLLKENNEDEFDVFGRLVGTKLRKIYEVNRKKYRETQHFICTLLNEVEDEVFEQ